MRPDRVIVGECRAGEAIDMVQAMNTGHSGSMSTVHSNSPIDCLARLETLCLMSEVDIPLVALQRQLASAINVIEYELQSLFALEPDKDGPGELMLKWTGARPYLDGKLSVDRDSLTKEW